VGLGIAGLSLSLTLSVMSLLSAVLTSPAGRSLLATLVALDPSLCRPASVARYASAFGHWASPKRIETHGTSAPVVLGFTRLTADSVLPRRGNWGGRLQEAESYRAALGSRR
jgi:hypothetical protein